MADTKKSFILYTDYKDTLSLLPDEDKGKLLMGLISYVESGVVPELPMSILIVFTFIRAQIDRDRVKYEKRCVKNRENVEKRWGAKDTDEYERIPNNTNVYDGIRTNTKHTYNDNDNENDTDNENDNNARDARAPARVDPFTKFAKNEEMKAALDGFVEMQLLKGKPLTDRKMDLLLFDLCKLSTDEETQIKIIDQSTKKGWTGFFKLDEEKDGGSWGQDKDVEKLFEVAARKGLEG